MWSQQIVETRTLVLLEGTHASRVYSPALNAQGHRVETETQVEFTVPALS
jgi:hypothetical protein